jgi:thiamine phosphate synthase YjbQ (UPF0047 family)
MRTLVLHTERRTQLVDITARVREAVTGEAGRAAVLFVPSWKHTAEGDRNPWSHVRSALTASSVTIPLEDGELALGELQVVFFCEFDGPRERKIHVAVT